MPNYLRILANNNANVDIITPDLNDGTIMDQADLTITAASQQSVTAVTGTGSGSLVGTITVTFPDTSVGTIPAIFIFPNPAGLTGTQAKTACTEAIDENRLKDGVGYLVTQLNNVAFESNYNKSTDYDPEL